MKKISIFNKKGGVGKTTIAVNLSACLAAYHGKKVLVVDCDSQANATSYVLCNYDGEKHPDIEDYLKNNASPEDLVYHMSFPTRKSHKYGCDIDLVAGSLTLDMVRVDDEDVINRMVDKYDYDYVIYDCPPYVSDLSVCALNASDYVLVPANTDSDSLSGFQILVDIVNKIKSTGKQLKIMGIVINCIAPGEALDKYILEQLKEQDNDGFVFNTTLRRASVAKQSRFFGEPICIKSPSSLLAHDYREFTEEFLEKTEG